MKWKAVKVRISGYTASFRTPGLAAYQLTLKVPPLSTIFGLISAAVGELLHPSNIDWVGYRFDYQGIGTDLETIQQIKHRKRPLYAGKNVKYREFLVYPQLILYLPTKWKSFFEKPRYPLLLGRTQDIAYVNQIEAIELLSVDQDKLNGVILPSDIVLDKHNNINASIHNLPIAFSDDPNRRPLGVKMFGILDQETKVYAPKLLAKDIEEAMTVPLYTKEWFKNAIE